LAWVRCVGCELIRRARRARGRHTVGVQRLGVGGREALVERIHRHVPTWYHSMGGTRKPVRRRTIGQSALTIAAHRYAATAA
jgi:hypothetical protein